MHHLLMSRVSSFTQHFVIYSGRNGASNIFAYRHDAPLNFKAALEQVRRWFSSSKETRKTELNRRSPWKSTHFRTSRPSPRRHQALAGHSFSGKRCPGIRLLNFQGGLKTSAEWSSSCSENRTTDSTDDSCENQWIFSGVGAPR